MSEDRQQLELLQGIARALGVTATVARPATVGAVYRAFRKAQPPGRAWQLVRALLRPFVLRFWRTPCADVTVAAWLEHVARRRREPTRTYRGARVMKRGHRPPCGATLNLERIRAIQLMNFGVDAGLISAHALARTKPVKARRGRGTRLTREQFETLVGGAHVLPSEPGNDRPAKFRALMLAMCDGMMRIGEARRIRRDRIGADGRYIVPASQAKNGEARVVAFTSECLAAFRAIEPYPGSPFAIPSRTNRGLPYDANTIRDWVYTVATVCGLNAVVADGDVRLKPHDIRATGASIAEEEGATIRQIQTALGHLNPETTLVYLRRAHNEDATTMARIMEGRRRGAKKSPNVIIPLATSSSSVVQNVTCRSSRS